ncbi:MAG: CusA/CzcA family heavy metal efflux RND transporter [Burkholderiaceae bacterium]
MNRIADFSVKNRLLILIVLLFLMVAGIFAFAKLNIEAYPDPVPPLVDVITQNSGQSAEEMERYITIPIEVQLAGIPNVTSVRTISLFGLSDVKVQFNYNFTYEQAQQQVINRLSQLSPLPNSASPQISPTSPTGEIYRYRVVGPPGYSVTDLKTIQDWILQRRFKAVPGVIDVTGWGGKMKAFEVSIDLAKMNRFSLSVPQVLQALNNSNSNVGGQTVNFGPQAAVVRSVGLVRSMDDIRNTMVSANNGSPVTIKDIATVSVGNNPRLGIAGINNDDDIVFGTVLMRRGEQSSPTIKRVVDEVEKINTSGMLPPGVKLEKFYDRSELIEVTTHTVIENLLVGILLIFAIQWIFLGDLRSAIIVSVTIPFALFFAIGIMTLRGESANLLSVGAIDFGLIVDATVIMVENIFRHLAHPTKQDSERRSKFSIIVSSANEVNRSILFSAIIIIAGFVPLFTLSGVEGHIFGPMAKTYAYAIFGGLIATFTVSPALSALLLPDRVTEKETIIVRWMRSIYSPVIEFALGHRALVLSLAAVLAVSSFLITRTLGMEFLPKLEEGNIYMRATMPTTISLEEANGYINRMRKLLKSYPEVDYAVSQSGRPDDGTDATGFFNAEFFLPLKPTNSWPGGMTKEKLVDDMNAKLADQFPGLEFNFSQYISDNVEEAASGVKGQNSIKLYGNDLETLDKTATQIKQVMETIPGIADLAVFRELGQPTVKIDVDRAKAARYGLAPGDINSTVQAAIGGQAAGNLYETSSDRSFPIIVRLAAPYRQSLDAMRRITIGAPNPGGNGFVLIPLSDVAQVNRVSGASFIYRENQARYIPIKFSVRGRDLGSAVIEAQQKVANQVKLPPGYRLEWVGEFGQLTDALARLKIVVPMTIALILVLLYVNCGSIRDTLLAGSVMPMAMVGGIIALFITGTPFSVSAAIGFIGLFGISVMEGIIVLSYFNQLIDEGVDRTTALLQACQTRLRPVMMTCNAACVGLLPAALSSGIGSQVQKPLALVIVGGILLAPALVLVVFPILIGIFSTHTRDVATLSPLGSTGATA